MFFISSLLIISVVQAMLQAGVTHDNIDIFELHDAYAVMGCLSLEV